MDRGEGSLPPFKSGAPTFNCVFSTDFEPPPKSLVNLNVTFMLNQAKPISIQSGEYPSLCCIIMDISQSQIHCSLASKVKH